MRGYRALLSLLLFMPVRAEIVDRIAVTLDREVISLSAVLADIRLTAFLNQQTAEFSPVSKRQTAERLIQQSLLRREMAQSRYPLPTLGDASPLVEQVAARYPSHDAYEQALAKEGLTPAQVEEHLLWELTLVRFIDYRFRPGVQIPADDIKDYYDKHAAQWKAEGIDPVPTLEESRDKIDEVLQKERANQALDLWIGEARTQIDISYREEAFQ